MDIEITPHVGAGAFRLGMSVADARAAAMARGLFRIVASDPDPGQVQCSHDESGLGVVLGFTKGELSGVALYRFWREDAEVRVLLDGLDVFRIPSEDLLERLAERGYAVEENDLGFDVLPELKVIFSNVSSYEYPVDEDGDPVHFDYVLVTSEVTAGR
ncbi:hypothetical protein [Streptomyces sp. NPDC047024]|uniref:hypothetical protein n=1 Tax=Streptomyces sp. NPDC047024 TaxID=3155476 RepID=UPI0033C1C6CC